MTESLYFAPNLIVVGAQKAGTTTLVSLLAQHPEIEVGREKEPDFFTRNFHRGEEWLKANYTRLDATWLVDASTSCTAAYVDPETGSPYAVGERMRALVPDARLIYVLRDPVERAYSSYWHHVRFDSETRSFREAVTATSPYIRMSRYAEHIAWLRRWFPAEQICILSFEGVTRRQQETMDTVCDFLGLQRVLLKPSETGERRNAAFRYNGVGRFIRAVSGTRGRFEGLVQCLKSVTPSGCRSLAAKVITSEIPPMSAEDRVRIATLLEADRIKLENEYQIRFPCWLPAGAVEPVSLSPLYGEEARLPSSLGIPSL